MQDVAFKIDHVNQQNHSMMIFLGKDDHTFYRFRWVNEEAGISQWDIQQPGEPLLVKYMVSKAKLSTIKTVKGTSANCSV